MDILFITLILFIIVAIVLEDLSLKTNKILTFKVHNFLIKRINFIVEMFEYPEIFTKLIDNDKKVLFFHQRYSPNKSNVIMLNQYAYDSKYQNDLRKIAKYYKKIYIRYSLNHMNNAIVGELDLKTLKIKYYENFPVYNNQRKLISPKKIRRIVANNIDSNIFTHLNVSEIVYMKKVWFINPKRLDVVFDGFSEVEDIDFSKFKKITFVNCDLKKLKVFNNDDINIHNSKIKLLTANFANIYHSKVDHLDAKYYLNYDSKLTNLHIGQLVFHNKNILRVRGYNHFVNYRKFDFVCQDLKKKPHFLDFSDINKILTYKVSDPINDYAYFLDQKYQWNDYKNYKTFDKKSITVKNEIEDLEKFLSLEEDLSFLMLKLYFENLKFLHPSSNLLKLLILDCNYFKQGDTFIKVAPISSYNDLPARIKNILEELK